MSPGRLLAEADRALDAAKRAGRNAVGDAAWPDRLTENVNA